MLFILVQKTNELFTPIELCCNEHATSMNFINLQYLKLAKNSFKSKK